jgi:uncharacterized membrane protein
MKARCEKQDSKIAAKSPMKTGRLFLRIALVITTVAIGSGFLFFAPKGDGASAANPGEQISYPVKNFQDGKARFYQYKASDGTLIKYFVIKSSDGVIRAAFDACDVCWPEGKGYEQKGDYMVCRNCGKRFASIKVNEVKGGCNPAPLNRQVIGDLTVIKGKDILEGRQYFNLSRRGRG